jgi:hypothetical protein
VNWKTGFFRIWIFTSAAWIVLIGELLGPAAWHDLMYKTSIAEFKISASDGETYLVNAPDEQSARKLVVVYRNENPPSGKPCDAFWCKDPIVVPSVFDGVKRPPSDCATASSAQECADILEKAGKNPFDAFGYNGNEPVYPDQNSVAKVVRPFLFAASIPPLGLLVLGVSIAWIANGFRSPSKKLPKS